MNIGYVAVLWLEYIIPEEEDDGIYLVPEYSTLALLTFWARGCPMHYGIFSSTPGLYPLSTSSMPQDVTDKYAFSVCQLSPER